MRVAIIDLGTNTFNLIVTEISDNQHFVIAYNDKISVKLGEGGINKNFIEAIPFQRGIDAIEQHLLSASKFNVTQIFAFATSAIRSASNGVDFVQALKQKFDLDVNIIDGNKEAELIYAGVRMGVKMSYDTALIMDIGGGSTEFILADAQEIKWKRSYNLGAARLLEKFKPSDPIQSSEIHAIESYLNEELVSLDEALKQHEVSELIGSSGSFDTFAEVITHKYSNPIDLKMNSTYNFNMQDFYTLHEELLTSTKEQRLKTPGIIEMRVDMIVISTIFTKFILEKYKLSKMRLSTYALKEGVIAELLKKQEINS